MSDHKPIAAELVPSPPSHAPTTGAERPPPCVACGGVHGGVGSGVTCLETTVRTIRRQRAVLIEDRNTLQDRVRELEIELAKSRDHERELAELLAARAVATT
jgi:hypothetical protein